MKVYVWRVLPEPSLSDHRHIFCNLVGEQEENVICRNQWTTCWVSYWEELWASCWEFLGHFGTAEETEIAAEFLQEAIVSSYEYNCPLCITGGRKKVPWLSPQLGRL
jgi:hypothetical protein